MVEDEFKITILSITLENFMCHETLKINFNKQLTCISGTNGSGKSAILTALGIVLGQRASFFDRGPSLKALIMTDKQYFVITLTINNHLNYHFDFFKEKIVIEKFVSHKLSKLKIMNEKKEVFSVKTADLEDILDLYSLDLTNPINFLTQDNAKKMLRTTKSTELYNFFERSIGIDEMTRLHYESKVKVNEMLNKIRDIFGEIKILEKDFKEKNDKLVFLSTKDLLAEKIKNLENEKIDLEKQIFALKIQKEYKKIYELVQEFNKNNTNLSEMKKNYVEYCNKKQESDIQKKTQSEKLKELEFTVRKIENELKNMEEQLKSKEELLLKINSKPPEETNIEELKREKEDLESTARVNTTELDDKIKICSRQLQHLADLKNNKLRMLGNNMEDVIKETKALGIIGPLAEYIELKEKKWFKAVSIILKNELSNFISKNNEEKNHLQRIFKKYNVNFKILTPSSLSNKIIEYRKSDYKTVLDVLEIKSPIVLNQLIILNNIEQIILIESRDQAHQIIRNMPNHVMMAYIPEGDRINLISNSLSDFRARHNQYFFENANVEVYEKDLEKLKKMKFEIENRKRQAKERLFHLETQISSFKVSNFTYENEPEEEIELIKSMKESLIKKKDAILLEIKEIQNLKSTTEVSFDYNKQFEIKNKISIIKGKITDYVKVFDSYKLQLANFFTINCSNINTENISNVSDQEIVIIGQSFNNTIQNPQIQLKRKKLSISEDESTDENISLENKLMVNADKIISENKDDETVKFYLKVKKWAKKRKSKISENKNSTKTLFNPKDYEKIKIEIKNIQSQQENLDQEIKSLKNELLISEELKNCNLEEDLFKIKKKLDFKKDLFKKYEGRIKTLEDSIVDRMNKREEMRIKISQQISDEFTRLTSTSLYEGCLIFNHENKTLDLKMGINDTLGSRGTLSGGERSFAGLCFIISMYKSASCFFKCLDEFDVFMDNINRKRAIKLLQEQIYANKLQVVVLTPLGTKDMLNECADVIVLEKTREMN